MAITKKIIKHQPAFLIKTIIIGIKHKKWFNLENIAVFVANLAVQFYTNHGFQYSKKHEKQRDCFKKTFSYVNMFENEIN